MKYLLLLFVIPFLLVACKTKQEGKGNIPVIRLEDKIANPVELSASGCFSTIEYLPLETSDSALIGATPFFRFYKDKIIVTSSKNPCQVFDRNTGKFVRSVGLIDKGPRGYSASLGAMINDQSGEIYFKKGNGFVVYSVDGEFLGEVKIPADVIGGVASSGYGYLDKENLLVYTNNALGSAPQLLACINRQDSVLKIFPYRQSSDTIQMSDILNISVFTGEKAMELYGVKGMAGAMVLTTKDPEIGTTLFMNEEPFWCGDGDTYFKENFNDTIFTVTMEQLIPRIVFDLGKYHWDFKERFMINNGKEHATIGWIVEGGRYLFFGCFDKTGFYDKESGETGLSKSFQLKNDLDHFMPLSILTATPEDEFVYWLQPLQIQTWFEENPDQVSGLNPEIVKLKELGENANPVLVFMKSR